MKTPMFLALLFVVAPAMANLPDGKACYMSFFEIYEASYKESPAQGRCVNLSYLRALSADTLGKATLETFGDLHGEAALADQVSYLQRMLDAYRDVEPGDSYQYCVQEEVGALTRDARTVALIEDKPAAEMILAIWVERTPQGELRWNFPAC